MRDRNISNMITSIIAAVITTAGIPLIIVKYANYSKLGVILLSIAYPFLLVYFILKSVYFGLNNDIAKGTLFRIYRVFIDLFICLVISYFTLNITSNIKWIIFGFVCLFSLFNVFSSIFDSLNIVRWILQAIMMILLIYIILSTFSYSFVVFMGIVSSVLFFVGNTVGRITNNKILLSSDIISVTLFSLFLLFI